MSAAVVLTRRQVASLYALGKVADSFTVQKLTTRGDVLVQADGLEVPRCWRINADGTSHRFPTGIVVERLGA